MNIHLSKLVEMVQADMNKTRLPLHDGYPYMQDAFIQISIATCCRL